MNIVICIGFLRVQCLRNMKKNHGRVMKLTKTLAEEDKSWQGHNTTDGQSDTAAAKNDTPLIAAAKNGIVEIVEAILDVFPQAIEHENNKRENVFELLYRIAGQMFWIFSKIRNLNIRGSFGSSIKLVMVFYIKLHTRLVFLQGRGPGKPFACSQIFSGLRC